MSEESEAREWLRKHADDPDLAGASLPQDHYRDQTGETVEHEQSTWLTAGKRARHGHDKLRSTEGHRGVLSLRGDMAADLDHKALVGRGGRSARELDVRVRMDRAMNRLRGDQRKLLRMRYYEGMTLEEMAAELGRAKQSVHEKLQTAMQDLYVAMAATWVLPYDKAEEHLGMRAHEGRPARDREGERRAAERVFTSIHDEQEEDDA